ncbi:colicin immunity domain-containing protein [Serratia proteamaculans]|uniref:colicin immunity domain-containing protein n=1 Tax=Serratia proteamaculans TaxID=28151 RepID=UPI0039BEBB38
MSKKLIDFAKKFTTSSINANTFSETYILMWKEERDTGKLTIDGKDVDEASSTIFCLADIYNPAPDRDDYELDEGSLKKEVMATLEKLNLI